MEQNKRNIIQNILKKLNFVNWDRYFGEIDCLTFFGWIDRKKDSYKDFITITFKDEGNSFLIDYATSSKEYTEKIAGILNCTHSPCSRIEYFCDLPNIIKEECQTVAKSEPSIKDEIKKELDKDYANPCQDEGGKDG